MAIIHLEFGQLPSEGKLGQRIVKSIYRGVIFTKTRDETFNPLLLNGRASEAHTRTNSNYLNLVHYKNLKFPDFSCLFFPITMKLFLFIQHKGFKRKMGVFDKFLKILPISGFRCKILILRVLFLVEIKRIRVNWCFRLDGLQ